MEVNMSLFSNLFKKDEDLKQIVLKIDGMKCGECESHVNDIIRRNFKVKKVSSSHRTGEVKILSKEELNLQEIEEKLMSYGYKIIK